MGEAVEVGEGLDVGVGVGVGKAGEGEQAVSKTSTMATARARYRLRDRFGFMGCTSASILRPFPLLQVEPPAEMGNDTYFAAKIPSIAGSPFSLDGEGEDEGVFRLPLN